MDRVLLFSHEGCPEGRHIREQLDKRGVSYRYGDIGRDAVAQREFLDYGGKIPPLLLVGSERFLGWGPDAEAALSRWCGETRCACARYQARSE